MLINTKLPNAKPSADTIPLGDIAQLWDNEIDKMTSVTEQHNHNQSSHNGMIQRKTRDNLHRAIDREIPVKRIKIGFISSDFGVHPIATLIRGLIQFIDPTLVELYCFAINDKVDLNDKAYNLSGD